LITSKPLFAAIEVGDFLSQNNIRYALIGGLAVQIWGEARLTIDADFTIATSLEIGSTPLVNLITSRYPSRVQNPIEFARTARMILITASNGIDVDISLALPGYEDEMLDRTTEYEIEPGKTIFLCSAEDLIIHKAVAGRPQDIADIQGIVFRQGSKLKIEIIRDWLSQFSEVLDSPVVLDRFERIWEDTINS
jgi:hypothetical protein